MKSESKQNKMDVKTFRELFVHRDDVHAIQQPKGTYLPVKEAVTDADIEAHLEGRTTLGLYQVKPEVNTITWAVLDIDLTKEIWSDPNFKLEDWEDRILKQADLAQEYFKTVDITSYREHSGNKGYHVWIFFKTPVPAVQVKNAMNSLFKYMPKVDPGIDWEIFPKQAAVKEGSLGNLVKGASGYHHKSKKFSRFLDDINPATLQYVSEESLDQLNNLFAQPINRCGAMNKAVTQGIIEGHAKHDVRVALGYLYTHMDEEKKSEEFIKDRFFKKMPNFDADTTNYNLERMREMYKPITCKALQEQGICPAQCSEIGGAKSPIAFYHWETKQDDAGASATNKLDFLFKSGNAYFEDLGTDKSGASRIKQISSFIVDLDKHTTISDGIKNYSRFKGNIKKDGAKVEFDIASDDYSSNDKLSAYIYSLLGPNQMLIDNITNIRTAIQKYAETEEEFILKQFGYNTLEEGEKYPTKYLTPSVIVDKFGVRDNDEITVDLSGEDVAENLDLVNISNDELNALKTHIKDDLLHIANYEVGHAALAHTFIPVIFPFIDGDKTRYSFFVRGESGKGKSFIMNAYQNFYGNFEHLASWSSTSNALGRIGYFFKDALFMVDDFKKRMFHKMGTYDAALTLLQNFSDNTARARMTATSEMQKTYVVKGWLTATGEDTPSGEASNLARMIPMTFTTKEKKIKQGRKVQKMKGLYPGFTAHYIHKILNTNPIMLNKALEDYIDTFYPLVAGQSNDVRVARNISLLATSYKFISEFLWSKAEAIKQQEAFVKMLRDKVRELVVEASDELSSEKFVEVIKELLSSGRARLQQDNGIDIEDSKAPIIGYYGKNSQSMEQVPHLVVGLAFNEVQKYLRSSGESLSHTKKAIISELFENEMVYDAEPVIRKLNSKSVRVIRLKPEYL
tara:strand:+ start:10916 stop:13642 length:2727 start_codon:yes stop_codon:yes gene_type:complete